MFRRALFIVLLTLPGSFVVLGLACIHPRVRTQVGELVGISDPLMRIGRAYAAARRRPEVAGNSAAPALTPGDGGHLPIWIGRRLKWPFVSL